MERKRKFNDGWYFHLGKLEQVIADGRTKCGACGGPSNATNEEGRFYPLPERFWAIFGQTGEKAGNTCMNLVEKLTDNWEPVSLPHDWRIRQDYFNPGEVSSGTGLHNLGGDCLPNGEAYYRKTFLLPAEDVGKRIVIQFEGVMRDCVVWVNGSRIGEHFSGYSAFELDITEHVLYGDEGLNVILVKTTCEAPEGWWGEGAGIYRDVWLKVLPGLHVAKDGCFVRTQITEAEDARLHIAVELQNERNRVENATIKAVIYDPAHNEVAVAETAGEIRPLSDTTVEMAVVLNNPRLWSPEKPELYTVELVVHGEEETDCYEQRFGIRSAVYTRNGLILNGQPVELKGVCVHQDFAGVGIALSEDILRYRLQRIKDMGGNAYRSSHHTASRKLLELCDEMGILVLNETRYFDMSKESCDSLVDMIKSSRNHPCVYMYCLENEEFCELIPQGKRILKRMIELGKGLDPDRPFTTATQFGRGDLEYQLIADVAGYNYDSGEARALVDSYENVCVMATEDASYLSTRGIYEDDPEKGWCDCYEGESYYAKLMRKSGIDPGTMGGAIAAMKLTNCYANNRIKTPELGGMFVWTAFDYRGETFPWNWPAVVSSYGAMDFCGFEKDVFYYWKSIWTTEPLVHVLPHWTWAGKEGETIHFEAYSNCEEIELFVNGVSQGRKVHLPDKISSWDLCYEPGELCAVGYRNGQEVVRETHRTAKEPDHLEVSCIYQGTQHQLFAVKVVDCDGNLCPHSCVPVTFHVEGGKICGVGNGDPACHEPDVSDRRTTFNGLALCITEHMEEEMLVCARAEDLQSGECHIR